MTLSRRAQRFLYGFRPMPGVAYATRDELARWYDAGVYTDETLQRALWDAFARHADRPAIVTAQRSWTYRQLDADSDRIGGALLELGLAPGDRALFQCGTVPELFALIYGCWKAGVIPVCTLAGHREREIAGISAVAEPKAHIVQGDLQGFDLVEFSARMQGACPTVRHRLVVRGDASRGALSLEALAAAQEPAAARRRLEGLALHALDVAVFQLSGGTTGTPKVIPRLQADYLYNMRANIQWLRYDAGTVTYFPFPAMHNAAMACFNTPTHLVGGQVVVQPDLAPEAFLATLERHRVTVSGAFLPIIVRMIESGVAQRYDLSSVVQFTSLSETPRVVRDLGLPGGHVFGMAEGTIMHTRPEDPEFVRFHCVGRPVSPYDEVRLCGPASDLEVATGAVGELCVRGPYTLRGYYRAESHNQGAFTADGFYRSGDLMRAVEIDGVRYFKFEGRLKDNIDRAGEKVHAEEVEEQVIAYPGVLEAAVVGMPDPVYGERVCAYLILERGATAPTVEQLGEFLRTRGLAKFKWPERIEVRDNFPTTRVGKISKGLLREDIARVLEAERAAGGGGGTP